MSVLASYKKKVREFQPKADATSPQFLSSYREFLASLKKIPVLYLTIITFSFSLFLKRLPHNNNIIIMETSKYIIIATHM